ncbi:MAG: lipid-transfer protein [Polyangiaceae bacterium UTPRO1]|jgi:acetyl-CoA acetyltransferase|nr:lipid-transfer protein [Myxococcales bacterium]OQY68193.1 MAG: lipid-transfer protein [Polyangiaceae bacterium UTPRO1]
MPTTLKNEAAIVGIGQTEFSKNSGRSELQLTAEAIKAALDDCGLRPADVDGMTTFTLDTTDEIEAARAVGIGDLTFFNRIPHGGGAAIGVVQHAVMAVATGIADVVVCYRGLNGRSGQRYSAGVGEGVATSDLIHWSWYMPYGLMTPASWVAMFTQRYMYEYGATADDLAEVAIATREHAVTNPAAFFHQRPLSRQEYHEARWIAEPLRLYDCCQETDGACAAIVTSVERARDLKQKPAIVRGAAQAAGADQESMTSFYRPSISYLPEMDLVAKQVYAQSGLGPRDIDAAVVYDAFTSIVLWQLESFGFCGRGEAKDFIRGGTLRRDGRLPTNTHGGQLSEAYIHGMNGVNEGVRLIRGTSVNQPRRNDHVLVTAGVGVPTSAMILGKE